MGKEVSEKFSFTKTLLKEVEVPEKRVRLRDEKIDGLVLDVLPSGRKSFRVYKRIKGQSSPVNITLGQFPNLTVEQARKDALSILAKMAKGINPNEQDKVDEKSKKTLVEVFGEYMSAKSHEPPTIVGYNQIMSAYVQDWHEKALSTISEDDIKIRHRELSTQSKAQADYCMRVIRALFNFAKYEYKDSNSDFLFPNNPVQILSHLKLWNNVPRKQSRITKSGLNKWFKGINDIRENDVTEPFMLAVCDFVEMALFTGLRKNELLCLNWDRVNLEDRSFYISKTKNGEPLELPICDHLMTIFSRRRAVSTNEYVFQADNEHGYVREPKDRIQEIVELTGIKFTLHDLRRTFTSTAELLKVGVYTLKRLLNHKTKRDDVTAGYTVLTAEELREPAEQIQNQLLLHMGLPLYGHSIDSRLTNFINNLSEKEKEKALGILIESLD
jgi:integrase